MDPNACLLHLRAMARSILVQLDNDEEVDASDVDEIATMVESLDSWIAAGGFLPERWTVAR